MNQTGAGSLHPASESKKVSGLFSVGSGVRIVCSWEEQDVQTKPAGFITP